MSTPKFWPLDLDPEDQIYDNVAWDLPGFRRKRLSAKKSRKRFGVIAAPAE
jgi:hypothetical protein